jgi:hypothetical protein
LLKVPLGLHPSTSVAVADVPTDILQHTRLEELAAKNLVRILTPRVTSQHTIIGLRDELGAQSQRARHLLTLAVAEPVIGNVAF